MIAALSQYIADGQLGGATSCRHNNACLSVLCAYLPEQTERLSAPDSGQIRQMCSHVIAAVERLTDTETCNKLLPICMLSSKDIGVHLGRAICSFVLCTELWFLSLLAGQYSYANAGPESPHLRQS